MLSTKLINLHSNISVLANYFAMSPVISPIAPPTTIVSTLFALAAFIKYKNLVLGIPDLAIGSYMTTENILTI